jgi:hypothetical protein
MPPTVTRRRARAILCALRRLPAEERARVLCRLPEPVVRAIDEEWWWQAYGGRSSPRGRGCAKRGRVLFGEKVRVPIDASVTLT